QHPQYGSWGKDSGCIGAVDDLCIMKNVCRSSVSLLHNHPSRFARPGADPPMSTAAPTRPLARQTPDTAGFVCWGGVIGAALGAALGVWVSVESLAGEYATALGGASAIVGSAALSLVAAALGSLVPSSPADRHEGEPADVTLTR